MTNNKNKSLSELPEKQTTCPTSTAKMIGSGSRIHKKGGAVLKAHSLHFGELEKKNQIDQPVTLFLSGVLAFIKFFLGFFKKTHLFSILPVIFFFFNNLYLPQ